ncbi:hypothetical protein Trydic_g4762 [Trypoxylus dichotomus]
MSTKVNSNRLYWSSYQQGGQRRQPTDAIDHLEGGRGPPGGPTGQPALISGQMDHRKEGRERPWKTNKDIRGRTLTLGKGDRGSGQQSDAAVNCRPRAVA